MYWNELTGLFVIEEGNGSNSTILKTSEEVLLSEYQIDQIPHSFAFSMLWVQAIVLSIVFVILSLLSHKDWNLGRSRE